MMRPRLSLLLLVTIFLAGCSQFQVRSRHDPNTDWSRMRTYAWVGLAQARLVPTTSFERKTKRLDDAVHQILERFPNG